MTHNCSREHDRELERHTINGDVDVYDNLRDQYIGRLVNIHAQGLMMVGDVAIGILTEVRLLSSTRLSLSTVGLPMPFFWAPNC
jgi:hypothetical protein